MLEPFTYRFRARYTEVDPQGVVGNARYLEYADLLIVEFYRERRERGMPADVEFHIARAEIDFRRPIRFDEMIQGSLMVERIGNSSMDMRIALRGADSEDDVRAEILLVQVHVDLASGLPQRIPDPVREAFGFPVGQPTHGLSP